MYYGKVLICGECGYEAVGAKAMFLHFRGLHAMTIDEAYAEVGVLIEAEKKWIREGTYSPPEME